MRLVWLYLYGYRRFEEAKINLDAPVIALVGPNEAGKSSILDALLEIGNSDKFEERDFTRDYDRKDHILKAMFLLDKKRR